MRQSYFKILENTALTETVYRMVLAGDIADITRPGQFVNILLDGLFHGFSLWWIAYLYVFLPLFFGFLLLPRRMPDWGKAILYPTVCALHGFLFGILYAPAQALIFGLDSMEKVIAWIAAGSLFDFVHGISNAAFGTLILPLSKLLSDLEKK